MKSLKLFDAAYLRLTAWYVVIIMVISLLFSLWVYTQAQHELRFGLNRVVAFRPHTNGDFRTAVSDRLEDSRGRLLGNLILLNAFVLVGGAGVSYMLARRTMRPIAETIDAQERFTADASHELRTPLAAMKSEIEVGLRDKNLTKEETVALLKSNLEEVDRLGNLAEGLLALTQTGAPLEIKPVKLHEVAAKAVKRLQPLAEARKVEVKGEFKSADIQADETALDKIISILLDNAIKYSPEKTTVTVKTYQKDNLGYLEVHDQGVGIKATELPHIFDRFYRADSSRSKVNTPGHGLGLSIAQKLANQMDAKLTATSTPGKGSTFLMQLASS